VEMTYRVDEVRVNFWMKVLEMPSVTALTPVTFFIVYPGTQVQRAIVPNSSSQTMVEGNAKSHLCVLTRDGRDHPSYRTRHPKASGPTDKLRMALSRAPMNKVGNGDVSGPKPDPALELPPNVTYELEPDKALPLPVPL